MPYNNPFDQQDTSPRRKLLSELTFWASVVFLLAFVVWIFVRSPKTVRNDFDHVSHPLSFGEGVNELVALQARLEESDQGWGPDFAADFPTVYDLLSRQEQSGEPYLMDAGGAVALALVYFEQNDKSAVGMDVLWFPYALETDDGASALTLGAPQRYTLRYRSATGVISMEEPRAGSFRLNFYTLGLEADVRSEAVYTAQLTGVFTDREADYYDLKEDLHVVPEGGTVDLERREESTLLRGRISSADGIPVGLTVSFGDEWYDRFDSLTLTGLGLTDVILSLN